MTYHLRTQCQLTFATFFVSARKFVELLTKEQLQPGTTIYERNPQQNELTQITQVLNDYHQISSLSLFYHVNEGSLQLKQLNLNSHDLANYASEIQSWKQALAPGEDLLFYGCNVAAGDDGNLAQGSGGGIWNLGSLNLNNDTISGNQIQELAGFDGAAGVSNYNGTVQIHNTIIAKNNATLSTVPGSNLFETDVSGNFTRLGYNLIGIVDNKTTGFINNQNGDQVGTINNPLDPKLGVLKINDSGAMATMALLLGSSAIDAGDPNMANNPTTDQRGVTRPQGAIADIGAFESIPYATPIAIPNFELIAT